jgi:hypothetical protein
MVTCPSYVVYYATHIHVNLHRYHRYSQDRHHTLEQNYQLLSDLSIKA